MSNKKKTTAPWLYEAGAASVNYPYLPKRRVRKRNMRLTYYIQRMVQAGLTNCMTCGTKEVGHGPH